MRDALRSLFPLFMAGTLGCAPRAPDAVPPEVPAAPAGPQLDPAQQVIADRLDAVARAALADPDAPVAGFAVKVVARGTALLERGYGFVDLDRQQPLPADAIFRIGSLSQQFTAAAILQLEEQGKLELDVALSRYLKEPYLKGASQPIGGVTLRQLLQHTSGIADFTQLPWYESHKGEAVPPADVVAAFADVPLEFEPGTRFAYSNSGYFLLGLVLEQVSGQSYIGFLRQHLFAPAGLSGTRYCPDAQDYPRAVPGYQRGTGKLIPAFAISLALPFSAGGLCSSVSELVRWSQALVAGKVVRPDTFARMSSGALLAGGQHSPYGFGLFRGELEGHPRIGHGGGIQGFASDLAYYPDADLYIAVLVNSEGPAASALGERLARIVLDAPEAELKDLPVSEAEVKPLLGTYHLADLGQTLRLVWSDGALRLGPAQHPEKTFRLRAQGGGVYAVPELRARIRFDMQGGAARALIVHQQGQDIRGERAP